MSKLRVKHFRDIDKFLSFYDKLKVTHLLMLILRYKSICARGSHNIIMCWFLLTRILCFDKKQDLST